MQSNLDFFKSLDFDDGLSVVNEVFHRFPLQYGTTLGLDGKPQIRPIEFKFMEDGVLYFDTIRLYTSYQEMQAFPYIQLCVSDQKTMTYVRLGGKVNFTEDPEVIPSNCAPGRPQSFFQNLRRVPNPSDIYRKQIYRQNTHNHPIIFVYFNILIPR